jgi:hypothetical protein
VIGGKDRGLRRHAMAAAASFAAKGEVDLDDKALALIADFMLVVAATQGMNRLPHAVMATARLLFSQDELERARDQVREMGALVSESLRSWSISYCRICFSTAVMGGRFPGG